MKYKSLYILLVCIFIHGCNSEVPVDQLTYKNGLKVIKESGKPFTGMSIRFEGGTTPVEIIEYKQGKLNGRIQTWHSNGELKEDFYAQLDDKFYEIAQAAGKSGLSENIAWLEKNALGKFLIRYGEEQKWYDNGEMESEGEYAEDGSHKIGSWQKWYKNGELNVKELYNSEGQQSGVWKIYCKNGALGNEIEFKAGAPVGTKKYWACDGKELDQINYVNGKSHGDVITYAKKKSAGSGSLIRNIDNAKSTEYEVNSDDYYKSTEGKFENGEKTGLWTVWDEDGKITTIKDYNKANFINPDYVDAFLKKGRFGSYYKINNSSKKWELGRYNFKNAKPDIEATQLYLQRKLVDPAKKIAIIKRDWLGRLDKDGGASQWTYPIIVAPELLFDVIKAYPEVKLDSVNTKGQNRLHLCTILMLGKSPGRCSLEHFNYLVKSLPVKAEDHDGMTALNYVTESFHKKRSVRSRRKAGTEDNAINALKTLVKTGADVNHKNGKGQTALMRALSHREYKISEALLDLDADVNAKDTEGHNAIYFVFFERTKSRWHKDKYNFKLDENRKNILSLLAQKGVKIDSPDLKGESIKDIALKHGAVKIVQFLETLSEIKSLTNQHQSNEAALPETNSAIVPPA